jgi:Ran-binding protein 1
MSADDDKNPQIEDEGQDDDQEEDEQPTVAPPSGDHKTLEEDEDVLCQMRCLLYRFVPASKEWKEKGRGDIKLLKHKETGKVRVLMRRDKIYKLAANHYIHKLMKLSEAVGNDKTLVWTATDFAEGDPVEEVLAARFTSTQLAQDWKTHFEAEVDALKSGKTEESKPAEATKPAEETKPAETTEEKK